MATKIRNFLSAPSRLASTVAAAALAMSASMAFGSPVSAHSAEHMSVSGGSGNEVTGPEFSPLVPERVLNTRQTGRVAAGSVVEVGLPSGIRSISEVSAAVLTVTVVNPSGWGFITVFPCGAPLPDASNVNYTDGLTRAATVFSKLGDGNKICVFTHAETDLLVDVTGVFYDTSAFTALTPFRLADTRKTETVTGGTSLTVPVHGRGGVAANATHAVVTLTAVKASGWGFLTAYACGRSVPEASNVNYDTGWTVANQAIVPLSASGELCVFTHADTDILVDVVGYFTGIDAIAAPTRIADTRPENSARYTSSSVRPSNWNGAESVDNTLTQRIIMVDASQIGDNVSSIYANITVIPSTGSSGFVAPIPCGATGDSDAASSVVNYAGGVIANSAVLDVNRAGYTCIMVRDYNQSATAVDVAVDVIGWTPAGWDTDGDGIEDTDETPGCETTSDCDNDGTPDVEEEAPCATTRSCETFNSDRTGRGEHPHIESIYLIHKLTGDQIGAYVQINMPNPSEGLGSSIWKHDDEEITEGEYLSSFDRDNSTTAQSWYFHNLEIGDELSVHDHTGELNPPPMTVEDGRPVFVEKAHGFCGTYPEFVDALYLEAFDPVANEGDDNARPIDYLYLKVSDDPWNQLREKWELSPFIAMTLWTASGEHAGLVGAHSLGAEGSLIEVHYYNEDSLPTYNVGDYLTIRDSCGGEKQLEIRPL